MLLLLHAGERPPPPVSASPSTNLSALKCSPRFCGPFALVLSYLPVSPTSFPLAYIKSDFWGLTFQAPHWAFLIFVYLFSAVSPPLLGCLLACLLGFLVLLVSHPFFSAWVYQLCWVLAVSSLALTLAWPSGFHPAQTLSLLLLWSRVPWGQG